MIGAQAYVDRNVGNGWVGLGLKPSIIRQGESHEGEKFDFMIQLQMDPDEQIGTTGPPFDIAAWRSFRGGVDSKDIAHDTMTVFVPCPHIANSPLLKATTYYPRLDKEGTSLIVYLRGKSNHCYGHCYYLTYLNVALSLLSR